MKFIKIKYLLFVVLFSTLSWYFFIKPDDYIIRFKANTSPGTLYKGVQDWNHLNKLVDSFDYSITFKEPYKEITQTLKKNNHKYKLNWKISSVNDSVSAVNIGVSQEGKALYNRITAPFFNTSFKKEVLNLIEDFKKGIDYQLKYKFSVDIIGEHSIQEMYFAYVEVKNVKLEDKATEMMKINAPLLYFLDKEKLKNGVRPFLIVDTWDIVNDKIDFKYCFPIKNSDSLPIHEVIKFDKLNSQKAIKAIYNGNYKTSDRAWFSLYEYALRNNIKTTLKPIEFYLSNPFYGGNELNWKAEVYFPLH